MTSLLFCIGLAGLVAGGEFLVRRASTIARTFHLSPLLIGLTVAAFALGGLPRIAGIGLVAAYGGYLWLLG